MQAQDSSDPTGVRELDKGKIRDKATGVARERKAAAALEMKVKGYSWEQIAETVGYPTARQALVATEKTLERQLDLEDRAKLRRLASLRLESLLQTVWPKAIDPEHHEQLAAQKSALEKIDRWIKLNGLDAPAELVVHSPTQSQIDAWVARVVSMQVTEVEEDEIIEGEWSDSDMHVLESAE